MRDVRDAVDDILDQWARERPDLDASPIGVIGRMSRVARALEARELTRDGTTVALTKLECEILRYLQDRQGQVVPRASLLRDVWGYEWAGGANAVDVAISGLRRKLGSHAKSLETVRGVGFRLASSPGVGQRGAR